MSVVACLLVDLQPAYHQVDPSFSYRMNVPDSKQQEMLARQRCEQVGSVIMLAAYFPVSVYINLLCLYLKVFSYMHIVLYCIFKPSLPYEVRCQRLAYTFCMLCLCISPSVHL